MSNRVKRSAVRHARWAARYAEGESVSAIARADGCSFAAVWKALRGQGVEMRPRGGHKSPMDAAGLDIAYRDGASLNELEARTGIAYSTIRGRLLAYGTILRPPSRCERFDYALAEKVLRAGGSPRDAARACRVTTCSIYAALRQQRLRP